jgi:hypothetical protein
MGVPSLDILTEDACICAQKCDPQQAKRISNRGRETLPDRGNLSS